MTGSGVLSQGGWAVQDLHWGATGFGYAIGLLVTLVAGLPLLLINENTWLLAAAGSAGLMAGGLVTGRRVGSQLALVNGALMGILYNFTVALSYFIGSSFQLFPEPLPGLPQGDSTFFFAWPLAQFAIGILGTTLGSRIGVSRTRMVA